MRKMFLGRGDHSPLRSRGLPDLLPFARGDHDRGMHEWRDDYAELMLL